MKIFVGIAILIMTSHYGETNNAPLFNYGDKERRFIASRDGGKQDPVLWMIFNQLDKFQTKLYKLEDENRKMKEAESGQINTMQLKKDLQDLQTEVTKLEQDSKGTTYVQWGKSRCTGSNTETVYRGQVGGGHYSHSGTGVNYLCLPDDPNVGEKLPGGSIYDYLYGAEYEIFSYNKPVGMKSGLSNHDVPCAVCNAKDKTRTLMIPGRKNCYQGWKKEYDGYLMSGHYGHTAASEYTCVDKSTDVIHGGYANHDGKLFYPVKTQCGSLNCPPYTHDTEVLCVVCTK